MNTLANIIKVDLQQIHTVLNNKQYVQLCEKLIYLLQKKYFHKIAIHLNTLIVYN